MSHMCKLENLVEEFFFFLFLPKFKRKIFKRELFSARVANWINIFDRDRFL